MASILHPPRSGARAWLDRAAAADDGAEASRAEGSPLGDAVLDGIRRIPRPVQTLSMPVWASLLYGLAPTQRRAVEGNLARVLPGASRGGLHAASYGLFVNYARALGHLSRAHAGVPLPGSARFEGRDRLIAARAQGRGVILATGRLGCWALGPFVLEAEGVGAPVLAVPRQSEARWHVLEARLRRRFRVVVMDDSPLVSLELSSLVKSGELLGVQLDAPPGESHAMVPFFGRPAPFSLAPALLARTTRAPIVPMFVLRDGLRGFASFVEEPIEVARTGDRERDLVEATARLVAIYEGYVRRYPHQWFAFHDVWATPIPDPDVDDGDGPAADRGGDARA